MPDSYEDEAPELSAAELSNIWSAYMENSMLAVMFQYFYELVEDKNIKEIVKEFLNNSEKNLEFLKGFFKMENMEVPHGFNNDDIKLGTPKLYSDVSVLFICDSIIKLRFFVYPCALNDSLRKDVREFFSQNTDISKSIQDDLVSLMLSMGIYPRPPQVTVEKQADYIENKKYLKGLLGKTRPLNVAEITNLNRLLQNALFSRELLVSYAQIASEKDVSQYFVKGKDLAQSIYEDTRNILEKEDLTVSISGSFKCSESTVPVFSDRIMMFFLLTCLGVQCFYNASQGITTSLRTDISSGFARFAASMAAYFHEGIELMMEKGYLERFPQIIDRRKLRND